MLLTLYSIANLAAHMPLGLLAKTLKLVISVSDQVTKIIILLLFQSTYPTSAS